MKLTKRQKFIASCINPRYGGFASTPEIRLVKSLVRGHYWDEPDGQEYCSYSPSGRRKFFHYTFYFPAPKKAFKLWKDTARKCAKLWAAGKYKDAIELDNNNWSSNSLLK